MLPGSRGFEEGVKDGVFEMRGLDGVAGLRVVGLR